MVGEKMTETEKKIELTLNQKAGFSLPYIEFGLFFRWTKIIKWNWPLKHEKTGKILDWPWSYPLVIQQFGTWGLTPWQNLMPHVHDSNKDFHPYNTSKGLFDQSSGHSWIVALRVVGPLHLSQSPAWHTNGPYYFILSLIEIIIECALSLITDCAGEQWYHY